MTQHAATEREGLARFAQEEAALRRVAMLVARGTPPAEVFEAVTREVARLIPAHDAVLGRYEPDGTVSIVTRSNNTGTVLPTGSHASVGAPIIVAGHAWGVLRVDSPGERPLPPDTEPRLARFTELVGAAISNSQASAELDRLTEEQSALRRMATLVAQGARPSEVFEAVSAEIGRLIPADGAGLARYETDGTLTALAMWTRNDRDFETGRQFTIESGGGAALVLQTRRPSRIHTYDAVPGAAAAEARARGWRSSVAAPIVVESQLWGVVSVASTTDEPLSADTEARLAHFTELVATAIANTESRAELAASRARIVATADATRRRIERDLHDGAQQRLVTLALELRGVQATMPPLDARHDEVSKVVDGLVRVLDELREMAHGIHPAILARGGLTPALRMLARRSPVAVELDVQTAVELPEPVEVTAYQVVTEALANTAKHTHASVVHVDVEATGHLLRLSVRDDGEGGADPARGSGLLGLRDRVEAFGGALSLHSPPGGGTSLDVELPLHDV